MWNARVGALVLLLSAAALVRAADPDFGFVPASVDLPHPGQPVRTVISFHNSSNQPLTKLRLAWIVPPYLQINAETALKIAELPAGADAIWVLNVQSNSDESLSESVLLRVEYLVGVGQSRVAIKPLLVKSRDLTPIEKLVDIQAQTALETLDSSREGDISLVFTNKSNKTVQVAQVQANGPSFLEITDQQAGQVQNIGPLQSIRRRLIVTANRRVIPGKYLLYFDVSLKSSEFGGTDVRTVALSQAITVGVLGESAIEKALGVASFLFLPGWLALTTAALLWRAKAQSLTVALGDAGKKFPLEPVSPEYLLLSISFSLLFAVALWPITRQWFFVQYGLPDILWVWLSSILIGAFAFFGYWKIMVQLRCPSTSDQPYDVLTKIARRGQPLKLQKVVLNQGSSREPAYFLLPGAEKDTAWISPALVMDFSKIENGKVNQAVKEELNGLSRPKRLSKLLKRWKQAISFKTEPIDHVRCSAVTEFKTAAEEQILQTT